METVVLAGFALPAGRATEVASINGGMSAQTQTFGYQLALALRAHSRVVQLSFAPVTNFPSTRKVFFRSRSWFENNIEFHELGFVNLLALKHVTRFFAMKRALKAQDARCPRAPVVVHGVHTPILLAASLRRKSPLGPRVVVLTDLPSLRTAFDSRLAVRLKEIDRRLLRHVLRSFDGSIALTQGLATRLLPRRPHLLLEAIAPAPARGHDALDSAATIPTSDPPVVTYAGGLKMEYGIDCLLEAAATGQDAWRLEVYGSGPHDDTVLVASKNHPRQVHFGGRVSQLELASVYERSTVLVNARPAGTELDETSFPSKLVEYMMTGTPVITTRLCSIPAEYERHLVFFDGTPADLNRKISQVLSWSEDGRRRFGEAARNFIRSKKSPVVQGERIINFLQSLRVGVVPS